MRVVQVTVGTFTEVPNGTGRLFTSSEVRRYPASTGVVHSFLDVSLVSTWRGRPSGSGLSVVGPGFAILVAILRVLRYPRLLGETVFRPFRRAPSSVNWARDFLFMFEGYPSSSSL